MRILVLVMALSLCGVEAADFQLREGTAGRFASIAEGARILTAKDDFIRRLSAFDRAARVKTDRAVSEEEFLKFVGANVVEWTAEEKSLIEAAVGKIRPAIAKLPVSFPKMIYFVKTTGAEEGNAFYTRDTAVVLPETHLQKEAATLEKAITHELFHILSRANPRLREALYEMIGFRKCDEIEFPSSLKARKITNPDAPRNDHYIGLKIGGGEVFAVPILFADAEKYTTARGGEFFDYLQFKFLLVEKTGDASMKFLEDNSKPRLISPAEASGFLEQVGKNTAYLIHPEEILAENFALLILGAQNIASPQILTKMKQILARKEL